MKLLLTIFVFIGLKIWELFGFLTYVWVIKLVKHFIYYPKHLLACCITIGIIGLNFYLIWSFESFSFIFCMFVIELCLCCCGVVIWEKNSECIIKFIKDNWKLANKITGRKVKKVINKPTKKISKRSPAKKGKKKIK